MKQRAKISNNTNEIRKKLIPLIKKLEANDSWYASIYFEKKSNLTYSANLKQTQIQDNINTGVVFRIFDGVTMFESATDDLDEKNTEKLISNLILKVKNASNKQISYKPQNWTERLALKLEDEIRNQIPKTVTNETPVDFGIQYIESPLELSSEAALSTQVCLIEKCKKMTEKLGLPQDQLTYVMARLMFADEETVFIDREVNLAQRLFRVSETLVLMSGSLRSVHRQGGLGGVEITNIEDSKIEKMILDLKDLKNAERLKPGKYKVLCGPVISGVIAHEAFGHAQEADTCVRGRSKAWELHKEGKKVGNEHATILNNPAIFKNGLENYAAWGSYYFDEEGWLAAEHTLLDKGILNSPMTNFTSAIRLKIPRTANGKRESWASGVYTRQTNTYFSEGTKTLEQLIKKMGDGFIATEAAGGMEDPKGMGIQVGIQFLREVKNGELTGKIFKGPAGGDIQMTGYVPDVLNSILDKSKIDFNDVSFEQAKYPFNDAGGCGKYHKEFVYAGCGGPYILMDEVTLG